VHELDSGGREGLHLAEVLAAALQRRRSGLAATPESAFAVRPARPGRAATISAVAAAVTTVATAAAVASRPMASRRRQQTGATR
jgi:hypothetical protein